MLKFVYYVFSLLRHHWLSCGLFTWSINYPTWLLSVMA